MGLTEKEFLKAADELAALRVGPLLDHIHISPEALAALKDNLPMVLGGGPLYGTKYFVESDIDGNETEFVYDQKACARCNPPEVPA